MTLLDADTFVVTEQDVAFPIVCESKHCEVALRKPAHGATHYGLFPCCGFAYSICKERVEQFAHQASVECNCGATVDGLSITVTEIEK